MDQLQTLWKDPTVLPKDQEWEWFHSDREDTVFPKSCQDYKNFSEAGYHTFETTLDLSMDSFFIFRCETLNVLNTAQPAKVSFLNQFHLRETFPKRIIVKKETPEDLEIDDFGILFGNQMLAFGDFNHDSVEDVLLYHYWHATEGSLRGYCVFALTRKKANARLEEILDFPFLFEGNVCGERFPHAYGPR